MSTPAVLLTSTEAASRLGAAPSTVNRWAAAGRLRVAFKTPGTRGINLFDPAEVEKLRAELMAKFGPDQAVAS